jgi:hypothetical protein
MKTLVLCGITLLAVAPAFAQTSFPAGANQSADKIVTLTGCVGGGAESKPITLTNAMIIPGTAQPGQIDQTPSLVPPPVSSPATEPPAATPPAVATPPSPTGTSGTKTSGSAVGTGGVITGTAPAGSSASSLSGYQLSGADMKPWIGQRVQVIGTFAPSAPSTTNAPAAARAPAVTGAAAAPPALEFHVQTVQPMSGPCPR